MKIQYLGHSAFYVETSELRALIDPFITASEEDLCFSYKDINYILVTHGHGDHLGNTIELAKASGAKVIANHELCSYLSKHQLNCHSMHIGGRAHFAFGSVKMTPALHGSGIETPEGMVYGGNPCGFVIQAEDKKLYHAGDTGLTMDMQLLAEEKLDLALLPIGGNYTMDIADAARAAKFLLPKLVIPMHYNTFPIINASPEAFASLAGDVPVKIMAVGEVYTL